MMVERAKWLAKMVHADQIRRDGKLYEIHPEAVANAVEGDILKSAAWLHDVLEEAKNPDTIRLLMSEYFPQELIHLVETLTHDKNIYYNHYIDIVCNNPKALKIKLADMIDNTNDINLPDYPQKQISKYREACIQMILRGIEVPKILKERLNIKDEEI